MISQSIYSVPQSTNEIPKNLAYSLRFPGELRATYDNSSWPTNLLFTLDNPSQVQYYRSEGFLTVQNAIANAFIDISSKSKVPMPEIRMRPFPELTILNGLEVKEITAHVFLVLALCLTFMNTVRFISAEKEKQLKEAMKIMGLASWMHYLGWFIRSIIMLMITMALVTVMLTV